MNLLALTLLALSGTAPVIDKMSVSDWNDGTRYNYYECTVQEWQQGSFSNIVADCGKEEDSEIDPSDVPLYYTQGYVYQEVIIRHPNRDVFRLNCKMVISYMQRGAEHPDSIMEFECPYLSDFKSSFEISE